MAAAYAALVSVKHIIDNLELHPRPPISLHKEQVESLSAKVSFLQEFLEGYDPHLSYCAGVDPLESRIADAAHAAEDVIEIYIVDRILAGLSDRSRSILINQVTGRGELKNIIYGGRIRREPIQGPVSDGARFLNFISIKSFERNEDQIPSWRPAGTDMYESVDKVIEQMTLVEKEAIRTINQLHTKSRPADSTSRSSSFSSVAPEKGMMVGADDVLHEMKDKLTSDRQFLQVIPIVGMGGIGKTTLAINLYHNPIIKEHFEVCVWATISQEYSIQQIFIQILGQLNKIVDQHLSEGDLGEILYKHLFGRKYLVIMDDMWNINTYDVVKRFLPDNKDCSRIVITTRLSNLAAKLNTSSSLEMKLLNEADSYNLLSKTVFGKECCPPQLEEIGRKIGVSCRGLPLSIVVVGGLLAKSEQIREFWEHVEENLKSIVSLEDDERCLKILHMSYKRLPIHLKPCFLYMGVFREDEEIYIPRVVKLWVAEGFLKVISGKSLEEVARMYIKDLADRNLILVEKIGRSGNIQKCRIHDLLRDLSLREAQKQRFYSLVGRTPSPQGIVCRHIVIPSTTPGDEAADAMSSSMSPLARSLTWHLKKPLVGDGLVQPRQSMSLLRVLDSGMVRPRDRFDRLVNSRFLDVLPNNWFPFPTSVLAFWNLQTLCVSTNEDGFYCNTIPSGIWYMPLIRHLQFPHGIHLEEPPPPFRHGDIVLENLQTMEVIFNFNCSEHVVKRIPNIKKLKVSYVREINNDSVCIRNLDCLRNLESLYCTFMNGIETSGGVPLQRLINFPHSLKKLSLDMNKKASSYGEEILDKIGMLPLLEHLRLHEWSFNGGEWETTQGRFCSLKFLFLNRCEGLNVWTIESSHFPQLDQLHLSYLDELKEIPLNFARISTLRVICVEGCSDSAVVSAKRILEEQVEFHGEEAALRVQVNFFNGNEELLLFASSNFHFTRNL